MAQPPRPPRLIGDVQKDFGGLANWTYDFYRAIVLEFEYANREETEAELAAKAPLEDPEFSGAVLLDDENFISSGSSTGTIRHAGQAGIFRLAGDILLAGGEIRLYGSAHASEPGNAIHEATSHKFKSLAGVDFAAISSAGISTPFQFVSTLADGTAPLVVTSGTQVTNLNASFLIGKTWGAPNPIGDATPNTGAFSTLSATGQITSTLATGTAPIVVASTTEVANLHAAKATILATARAIGGVAFDGSAAITVETATSAAGFTVTNAFGCNGKTAQAAYTLAADATDLASAIALANDLKAALIANGTGA